MITPILLSIVAAVSASGSDMPISGFASHPITLESPISQGKKIELSVMVGDKVASDQLAVAGTVKFTVKVTAADPINSVEFYVGDDIRDTDGSTPYEFTIDTLGEAEGTLKITFIAYTSEGDQGKKVFTLNVDNGGSKGAEWNVAQGNECLSISKWDEAIRFGKVALKVNANFNPARLLMARANMGKGAFDQAQKYAEDAISNDPKYFEALDFLSSIHLQRAFATFNRPSGKREETLAIIRQALKGAVENRKIVLDNSLEKLGAPTDANRLAVADMAIKAGRYSVAVAALSDAFKKDSSNSAIANRITYAQLRSGRIDDAAITMQENQRANGVDGFGYALIAIIQTFKGADTAADEAMKEAILSEPDSIGVQTSQAFIALKRGRIDVMGTLITRLAKDQGQRTEVSYFLSTLNNAAQRYVEANRAFEQAVLAEPTNYDMYVQRGNEALAIIAAGRVNNEERQYQYDVARTFYDTALIAKPESAEALSAIAIIDLFVGKKSEAASYAKAASQAAPGYAPGQYVKAMADSVMESELKSRAEAIRKSAQGGNVSDDDRKRIQQLNAESNSYGKSAVEAMNIAMKLDKTNLSGRTIPTSHEAFSYFIRHNRLPLLVLPK
jgi:tetratricopeptide (TPR) repeat protein